MGISVLLPDTKVKRPVISITGTLTSDIVQILLNEVSGLVYISGTNWSTIYQLSPGTNTISFTPIDSASNRLTPVVVTIELEELEAVMFSPFGTIDQIGLTLDTTRLAGEKNQSFKHRLLHAGKYRSDTNRNGLAAVSSRELSLSSIMEALEVAVQFDVYHEPIADPVLCRVTADNFELTFPGLVITELQIVDPVTLTVEVDENIAPIGDVLIRDSNGNLIDASTYDVDRIDGIIYFKRSEYGRQDVEIEYTKIQQFPLTSDLDTLALALTSYTYNSTQIVSGTVLTDVEATAGTRPSADLVSIGWTVIVPRSFVPSTSDLTLGLRFAAIPSRVHALREVAASYLNDRGAAYDAKLEGFLKEMQGKTGLIWKWVKFDRDVWQSEVPRPVMATSPHLWDPLRGYWNRPDISEELTLMNLIELGLENDKTLHYHGVPKGAWHSGVGTLGDLYTEVKAIPVMTMEEYFLEEDKAGVESGPYGPGAVTTLPATPTLGFGILVDAMFGRV